MSRAEDFVSVIWEARAKPGCEDDMRLFLKSAVTLSRNDPGCIDYEMHEVADEAGVFIAYERWVSRDALNKHLTAPRMSEMAPRLLTLMQGSIEDGMRILHAIRPDS
ncbi:putative quinol monooxygenase [Sphingomonas sp. HF-S4]|uniref:Quinol monooxygenase n=1 Tax=Sphingomonas agrestis TaxID=3080540 RepID=A0ABU3Y222_9SPHN|nr:putative quinol monooxygenase [Sphingomonas sp. HF-S4]MDV3455417.1 putative quinol monooxygenase [Sphingomonas sp. HF-S4]